MHLTCHFPPVILKAMKFIIIPVCGALVFTGNSLGATTAGSDTAASKAFVRFMVGVELIDNDRNFNTAARVKKYKQLCSLTGMNAASAVKIIEQYKNRPEEWQTMQTTIIEMLQAIPLTERSAALSRAEVSK